MHNNGKKVILTKRYSKEAEDIEAHFPSNFSTHSNQKRNSIHKTDSDRNLNFEKMSIHFFIIAFVLIKLKKKLLLNKCILNLFLQKKQEYKEMKLKQFS